MASSNPSRLRHQRGRAPSKGQLRASKRRDTRYANAIYGWREQRFVNEDGESHPTPVVENSGIGLLAPVPDPQRLYVRLQCLSIPWRVICALTAQDQTGNVFREWAVSASPTPIIALHHGMEALADPYSYAQLAEGDVLLSRTIIMAPMCHEGTRDPASPERLAKALQKRLGLIDGEVEALRSIESIQ